MSRKIQKVEILYTGRDFVDGDGNVRHISDLTPDMEPIDFRGLHPADQYAVASLKRATTTRRHISRRGGRSHPEVSGRDIGLAIDSALFAAEWAKGSTLTDDEERSITAHAERQARGLE